MRTVFIVNFFEFLQILYATHFVLGTYLSLLMWRFIPAVLAPFFRLNNSATDIFVAVATTVVSVAWYFVWYGSIIFALRGRFPVLSARSFSILLGSVYTGWLIINYVRHKSLMTELVANNPLILFSYGAVVLVSICGALFLPRLKAEFEREQKRIPSAARR